MSNLSSDGPPSVEKSTSSPTANISDLAYGSPKLALHPPPTMLNNENNSTESQLVTAAGRRSNK